MKETVLITGAGGLLAKQLGALLQSQKYQIKYLSSNKKLLSKKVFYWNYKKKYIDSKALQNANHIIHLSGFSISNKWTSKNKQLMYDSRIKTSQLIYYECKKLNIKPETFISASAMGYYGFNKNDLQHETELHGQNWMGKLCFDWEKAADNFNRIESRVIKLRFSLIIDKNAEIIHKTCLGYKFGLGFIFGSGNQSFPWIHIKDVTKFILFAIKKTSIKDVFNITSPQKISHYEFVNTFKKIKYKKSILIHIPKCIINMFLRGKTALLFNNIQLSEKKMKQSGFTWNYPTIKKALIEAIG